jgi:hypothetical protein
MSRDDKRAARGRAAAKIVPSLWQWSQNAAGQRFVPVFARNIVAPA